MKKRNLNITADDLGLAECVNEGIFFGLKTGLIDGTCVMASGSAFDHAVSGLSAISGVRVGIHLVFVEEKSVLPPESIPSLIGDNGRFHKDHKIFFIKYLLGKIKLDEIKIELEAQIKKCLGTGLKISFLNSHQHLHLLPGICDVMIELARKYKIPYIRTVFEPRMPGGKYFRWLQLQILNFLSKSARKKINAAGLMTNDYFIGFLNAGGLKRDDLKSAKSLADKHSDKYVELGCHPGFEDEKLKRDYKNWSYHWRDDLKVLEQYSTEI